MGADILIFKKKGNNFEAKIAPGMSNGHTPHSYHMKINLQNPRDLALFLKDLKFLHNAPVDKAFAFYQEAKSNPFFD